MLTFDQATHKYTFNGKPVPSVTKIINAVIPRRETDQYYLDRGTAVHAAAALVMAGTDHKYDFDAAIMGQVEACRKWKRDFDPQVIAIEQSVGCDQYCGTPDLICKLRGRKVVVDWKASLSGVEPLQLAAYGALTWCKLGMTVILKEDGNYNCSELIPLDRWAMRFRALVTVYGVMVELNKTERE